MKAKQDALELRVVKLKVNVPLALQFLIGSIVIVFIGNALGVYYVSTGMYNNYNKFSENR